MNLAKISANGQITVPVQAIYKAQKDAYRREDGIYVVPIGCLRD